MKLNFISMFSAIIIAALITYLFYSIGVSHGDKSRLIALCISSFICFATTLGIGIGISYPDNKSALNIRTLALLAFFLLLAIHIPMAIFLYNPAFLIVPAAIVLLIFIMSTNTIFKSYE